MRLGLISLIPKKEKDQRLIANNRPITLLSIFYKIISGAIADKLKLVLHYLINPSQKAYVQGRYIGEVSKNLIDVMRKLEEQNQEACVMLVDFSKAFDTMSHQFISNTLKIFGFGNGAITQIMLLFKNRSSQVCNAGHTSRSFSLGRGVPQGDPISAYIFILGMEILTHRLRTEKFLRKIRIKGKSEIFDIVSQNKIKRTLGLLEACYADDLTLILPRCRHTVKNVVKILNDFRDVSGLAINVDKTYLINIGVNRDQGRCLSWITTEKGKFCPETGIEFITEFVLLGIKFSNYADFRDQNFFSLEADLIAATNFWGKRLFSPLASLPPSQAIPA